MKEVCPQWSPARVALLWQVLDENNEGKIGKINLRRFRCVYGYVLKLTNFLMGLFRDNTNKLGLTNIVNEHSVF